MFGLVILGVLFVVGFVCLWLFFGQIGMHPEKCDQFWENFHTKWFCKTKKERDHFNWACNMYDLYHKGEMGTRDGKSSFEDDDNKG